MKLQFIEQYDEELRNHFAQNEGRAILDDNLEDDYEEWLENMSLEDLKVIIFGELAETDDEEFKFIGTKEQFTNSKIN